MKTPELKPCPFCGSVNLKIFPSFVACAKCDGMGPDKTADKTAIEKWNTRVEVKAEEKGVADVTGNL